MKTRTILIAAFSFLILFNPMKSLLAGEKFSNAGEYLSYINKEMDDVSKDMWDYTSAAAHGKSARKVENRRKELLKTTKEVQKKIQAMPPFDGDKSLRDTMVSFLTLNYNVLNNDYAKVLDMEEIAEQSYDAMEAYLTAQEKAGEKLDLAAERMSATFKSFAANHNIRLSENKDKTSKKLESAGKVIKYYNSVYLVFFKSNKQEAYMMSSLIKNDLNGLEQNKNSLKTYSNEGLGVVALMKPFEGDAGLKMACKDALTFYKMESETKMNDLINYYLKKENFEKIDLAFKAKQASARTKEDVDQYNKAVNDFNMATAKYNATNDALNKNRSAIIEKWNTTALSFMDKHVPKYK
jgi:hypothetical protein